jgi:hypothetical protein
VFALSPLVAASSLAVTVRQIESALLVNCARVSGGLLADPHPAAASTSAAKALVASAGTAMPVRLIR